MNRWHVLMCLSFAVKPAVAQDADDLNGVWATDGYGTVADIQDGFGRLYQMAGKLCLAERSTPEPLTVLLPGMTLEVAEDGQSLVASFPMDPYKIRAVRIGSLPKACRHEIPDTPRGNFDAFAGFFEHSYPFFDLHGVDWSARVAAIRDQVTEDTDDDQLFELMSQVMEPLHDGHLALIADINFEARVFAPHRGRTNTLIRNKAEAAGLDPKAELEVFRQRLWYNSVGTRILDGKGHFAGNERIQYGMVSDRIGYLALATMGGFGQRDDDPQEQLIVTQEILDHVMGFFDTEGADALILDLSLNLGGHDFIAREVASRFAFEPILVYSKFAADAENPIKTRVIVRPSEGRRFLGDVTVLTSNVTISAGEILTLSLRAMPQVQHVGEKTRGAFSSVLTRTLPNGWELNLSNETYLDAEGRRWEGRGIEPDTETLVFSDHAPIKSHAQAVMDLVARLSLEID
ncbi:MAG: S41 family peptidase [Pseudomonadota bacterium]